MRELRSHVRALIKAEVSLRDVAVLADVSYAWVYEIATGKAQIVGQDTAAAIMSVSLESVVTSIGLQRRLQALMAQGWSSRRIADHAGVSRSIVCYAVSGQRVPHLETRQILREVYEQLCDEDPTWETREVDVAKVKAAAVSAEWLPPHAWEETPLGIDDPRAKPMRQKLKERHAELFDEYLMLYRAGVKWEESVARLSPGWSPESMVRRAYRLGYGDVVRKFRADS